MHADLAIVTGTSRGIGRAVALALLERGFEVAGVSRNTPDGLEHERYRHFVCDLTDLDATRQMFEAELPARMRPDARRRIGLVNNAGRLDVEPVVEARLENLAASLTVNVAVPIYLHGWALRHAADGAAVRIVDVSSGAASSPYPGWVAYCASKAALEMAGEVLAVELDEVPAVRGRDVAVVAYAPGVVATRMQEQIRAASDAAFPRRARFLELHANDELLDPARPAAEIAELLRSDGLPSFSRRHFGG